MKELERDIEKVRRRNKLPSVFCAFPWIRVGHGGFADCETAEDSQLVRLYKRLLKQEADVSELDDEYGLTLAVDVPKSILQANGKSGRSFGPYYYYWKFYDVHYLLTGSQPAEAVPIAAAGFSSDDLALLEKPDRYLAYVRALEEYSGKPKGHYFPLELEKEIEEFERRLNAKMRLKEKLRALRIPEDELLKSSSRKVPEKLKNKVLQDHEYTCIFDGRTRPDFPIHVHHVIPRKLIERLCLPEHLFVARENLVACCSGCNIAKSDELSEADVRFYLRVFAKPDHPNNPLLPLLKKIADIQCSNDTSAD